MKRLLFFILFFSLGLLTVMRIVVTTAFYNDTAQSAANSFSAEEVFASATPSPIPMVAPGDIVINEINWAGNNSESNDEWIELRNIKSHSIDISNWVVENLGTTGANANVIIPSDKIIPAQGFFLISRLHKDSSKINVDSDFITTSISLSNTGEQLRLKTNLNMLVDTANATSGAWFAGSNSTPKKSMERKDLPADGTISTNWQTATTHTGMDAGGTGNEFATPKNINGL